MFEVEPMSKEIIYTIAMKMHVIQVIKVSLKAGSF
jgi:hypothetical protein